MEKKVIVIGAVSSNGVYGEGDIIPWYSKVDIDHFKRQTTGHTVVMGHRTWESLPKKFRPLLNRHNIVVTRSMELSVPDISTVSSIEEAISIARTEKVFVIGGSRLWYLAMDIADEALITIVGKHFPITQSVTHIAKDLLLPFKTWPEFYLKDSREEQEIIHGEITNLCFLHWVK